MLSVGQSDLPRSRHLKGLSVEELREGSREVTCVPSVSVRVRFAASSCRARKLKEKNGSLNGRSVEKEQT